MLKLTKSQHDILRISVELHTYLQNTCVINILCLLYSRRFSTGHFGRVYK